MKNPTIYTFSILRSTMPAFASKLPYISAILEDAGGARFATLLEEYEDGTDVEIGQEVFASGVGVDGKTQYSLVKKA